LRLRPIEAESLGEGGFAIGQGVEDLVGTGAQLFKPALDQI